MSDWSSDVCASDLGQRETEHAGVEVQRRLRVPDPQHGVVEHEAGGGGVADRRDTGYGGKIVAGLGGHVENSWWGQRIIAARSSRRCCDGSFSDRKSTRLNSSH